MVGPPSLPFSGPFLPVWRVSRRGIVPGAGRAGTSRTGERLVGKPCSAQWNTPLRLRGFWSLLFFPLSFSALINTGVKPTFHWCLFSFPRRREAENFSFVYLCDSSIRKFTLLRIVGWMKTQTPSSFPQRSSSLVKRLFVQDQLWEYGHKLVLGPHPGVVAKGTFLVESGSQLPYVSAP